MSTTSIATAAETARKSLAGALQTLQSDPNIPPAVMDVAAGLARAMGPLFQLESGSQQYELLTTARNSLQDTLEKMQSVDGVHPGVEQATAAIAKALGVIFGAIRDAERANAPAPQAPAQPAAQPPKSASQTNLPAPVKTPSQAKIPAQPMPATVAPAASPDAASRANLPTQQMPVVAPAPAPATPITQPMPITSAPVAPIPAVTVQVQRVAPVTDAAPAPAPVAPVVSVVSSPAPTPVATPAPVAEPVIPVAAPLPPEPSIDVEVSDNDSSNAPVAYAVATVPPQPVIPAAVSSPQLRPPSQTNLPAQRPVAPASPVAHTGAGGIPHGARGLPRLETEVGVHSESNFFTDFVGDIQNEGGIFVATYHTLPINAPCEVFLTFPGNLTADFVGRVKWKRETSGGASPGLGIAIVDASNDTWNLIKRFISKREPIVHET